jgi:hypothetical protein
VTNGLSNRAAGKIAGCSHVAVAKAKARGDLLELPGGGIDQVTLRRWMRSRRQRGGNRPPGLKVTAANSVSNIFGPAAPPAVLALAAIACRWPSDFASAILPHLSYAMVTALYERSLAELDQTDIDAPIGDAAAPGSSAPPYGA